MIAEPRATVDGLRRVPEHRKAEIVGGELKLISPTRSQRLGSIRKSNRAGFRSYRCVHLSQNELLQYTLPGLAEWGLHAQTAKAK